MKNNETIKIDNLIALCNMMDNFPKFNRNLRKFLSGENGIDEVYSLHRTILGITTNQRVKEFYKQNKKAIENIQKYSSITAFVYDCYSEDGTPKRNLFTYYSYLCKNIGDINKIIFLLYSLKILGFTNITFNDSLDFTDEVYSVSCDFSRNNIVTYLENMHLVFNDGENIKYMSSYSNYKINAKVLNGDFLSFNREIIVNNLLFSANELPHIINRKYIFDEIINLGYFNNLDDLSNEDKKEFLIKLRNKIDDIINELDSETKLKL